MRQRVGLARALAVDADILLMDEPFASVDEQIRRQFQEDLLRLLSEERKTVIFVTHSIEEAVYVSDQIVILTRGPGRVSKVVRPASIAAAGRTRSGATPPTSTGSNRSGTSSRATWKGDDGVPRSQDSDTPHAAGGSASMEVARGRELVLLLPPFTEVLAAFPEVVSSSTFAEAAWITLQAFLIGMGAVLRRRDRRRHPDGNEPRGGLCDGDVGEHLRELAADRHCARAHGAARLRARDDDRDRVPVLGLGDRARHPGRSGAGQPLAPSRWAGRSGPRSGCCTPRSSWKAALPELLAGIRLGLIRGLKGVIIGQLLIAVLGVGYLFELYSRNFLMPEFWALLIILFTFAFMASEAVAYFERKVAFYASSR